MKDLTDRRIDTKSRIEDLRTKLSSAEDILRGKACVYATGSFGRCEAGKSSDLDLFIVGKKNGRVGRDNFEGSMLKRLDDIRVKADLIEVTCELKIPDFDGDGRYLVHYSVDEITKTLGTPDDDATNTFTARLLLLLESTCILEKDVYSDVIDDVIASYWGDYEKHKNEFMPAFLSNDILRLWRTFCVNYEARTEKVPEEKRIKRKIKNYKLKYSRLLTCYSALLYLLSKFAIDGTVSPGSAKEMTKLTPTERLEDIIREPRWSGVHDSVNQLLIMYSEFLGDTNFTEDELMATFSKKESSRKFFDRAAKFGDCMYLALAGVGEGTRFHRLLVV